VRPPIAVSVGLADVDLHRAALDADPVLFQVLQEPVALLRRDLELYANVKEFIPIAVAKIIEELAGSFCSVEALKINCSVARLS
jgi:uncharacterized membrane protein YecN with MAPEG domain